ncbi:MAG: hypothetical protein SGI96_05280 [Bacteroidota bacterium]|nr:hypothetical protein [Bacteroidota bacterium]
MINRVYKSNGLQQKIEELEALQAIQMADLKSSAGALLDGFSPSQMLRGALRDVTTSPDLRMAALDTAVGIGAGFLGRKLYVRNSHNFFRKIAGSAVQLFVTTFVRNKMSEIRDNKAEKEED